MRAFKIIIRDDIKIIGNAQDDESLKALDCYAELYGEFDEDKTDLYGATKELIDKNTKVYEQFFSPKFESSIIG